MISHSVEISIAGGLEEKVRGLQANSCFYFYFLNHMFIVFYGTRSSMHLIDMGKTKLQIK